MKRKCVPIVMILLMAAISTQVMGQTPVVTVFDQDGILSWTSAGSNTTYYVEWTSGLSASDLWHSSYSTLTEISTTNQTITVAVPRFYRVLASTNSIAPPSQVPKTGQTTVYQVADDGSSRLGVQSPTPRFVVGTGIASNCVIDRLTGLMWLKNPDSNGHTWSNAIIYCDNLDGNDGRGGFDDWRLPNARELGSVTDFQKSAPALPASHPFAGIQAGSYYWTSTTLVSDSSLRRWVVSLYSGAVDYQLKANSYPVWPVRGGP